MDKQAEAQVHDLATRIYVELVSRNTEITQDSVKMGASAVNIATLSVRLAHAFVTTEAQIIADAAPVTNFVPGAAEFASWTK
jgi:hypothetical protein